MAEVGVTWEQGIHDGDMNWRVLELALLYYAEGRAGEP